MKSPETPEARQFPEKAEVAVPALIFSRDRGSATGAPAGECRAITHASAPLTSDSTPGTRRNDATILGEAEVFLNHLNAIALPAITLPAPPSHLASAPVSDRYLKERIRAVRRENRELREDLGTISKENQSLQEQLGQHLLHQRSVEEQVRTISKENQGLREEVSQYLLEKRGLEEQAISKESRHLLDRQRLEEQVRQAYELLRRCQEKSQAADRCLQEIMASLNWKVAHRFHCLRRSFKRCFGTGRPVRDRSSEDQSK